jgi:glycolate oxidase iron-sulfur subunit
MSRKQAQATTQTADQEKQSGQEVSQLNRLDLSSTRQKIQRDFSQKMDLNELLNCTRCGFCQPSCPTFVQTEGKEASSPRGRIALMKAVVDGILEPDEQFERELGLCLGCRACESACPSGVQYGQLLEQARAIIHEHKTYSWPVRTFRSIFFKRVLPSPAVLKIMGTALWLYQRSGLQWLARKTKLLHALLPSNLVSMERIIPEIVSPRELWRREKEWQQEDGVEGRSPVPASDSPQGNRQHGQTVQFFKGCIMDMMFRKTNQRTVQLVQKEGAAVHLPRTQTCCGALHAHAGDVQTARELAKRNIVAFEQGGWPILTNAGGCGAFLKEYPHLLKDETAWQERAEAFAGRIVDISQWLTENAQHPLQSTAMLHASADHLPAPDEAKVELVTYQDSCHLRHGLKVDKAPRSLLQQLEGVRLVELRNAHMCCGSAGIYNIIEQEMSMKVLDHKMKEVKKTQAKTIVTSNPGCLLQMQLGIQREGLGSSMKAVHLVDFLYEQALKNKRSDSTVR